MLWIIKKSKGSFLWVTLVRHELHGVNTESQLRLVTEDGPSDMVVKIERITPHTNFGGSAGCE